MSNDKNKKILLIFTALIILSAAVTIFLYSTFNQSPDGTGENEGIPASATPTPTPTATPSGTISTSTPLQTREEVRFTVYVDEGNIEDCGWTCREIPATLKNKGEKTAHNVEVTARFYCDGDRIDVNGNEYLSIDLGTLEPGESKTRTEEVDVGFGGGLCIQNNGARIVFTVTSDEKTMTLEETYNP